MSTYQKAHFSYQFTRSQATAKFTPMISRLNTRRWKELFGMSVLQIEGFQAFLVIGYITCYYQHTVHGLRITVLIS